jgi:hypothetical protein
MRGAKEKVSLSPAKRWTLLMRRLAHLRRRCGVPGAHMKKSIDSMNAVCREMSNLKPDAFVVIHLETGVTIHGLNFEVKEGIEAHGLRCILRAPQKEGGSMRLVFEPDSLEGLPCKLLPGKKLEGGFGYRGTDREFTIFFALDKKKALAFARKQRTKRP